MKKQKTYFNLILGAALVILIPLLITTFQQTKSAQAAWLDDNFLYRQTIAITNAGSALSNAQYPITIDTAALVTAGKMQSDCDDIRVTDINGNLLSHWVHQCNTTTTRIYVLTGTLITSSSTVYLYYGNPSAANREIRPGKTAAQPGISCKSILDHSDSTGDGTYYIDPNAVSSQYGM